MENNNSRNNIKCTLELLSVRRLRELYKTIFGKGAGASPYPKIFKAIQNKLETSPDMKIGIRENPRVDILPSGQGFINNRERIVVSKEGKDIFIAKKAKPLRYDSYKFKDTPVDNVFETLMRSKIKELYKALFNDDPKEFSYTNIRRAIKYELKHNRSIHIDIYDEYERLYYIESGQPMFITERSIKIYKDGKLIFKRE